MIRIAISTLFIASTLLTLGCDNDANRVIDTSERPKSTLTPEEMDEMMKGEPMTAPKSESANP